MPGKVGLGVVGGTIASLCLATAAEAALLPYRFDKVAETGTIYQSLGVPALNDSTVAAFYGAPATGGGIYYGNQFYLGQVPAVPNVSVGSGVDINNAGQVAFYGTLPRAPGDSFATQAAYRADPGGITTIGTVYNGIENIEGGPVIANNGQVGFSTFGTIQSTFYKGDGTGPMTNASSSTGTLLEPRINNSGKTANINQNMAGRFLVYGNQAIVQTSGFFTDTMFTDPDYGVPGTFAVNSIDVGDNDRVVFAARWNNMTNAFYLWDNGTISKVAGTNGLTGIPAINDLGVVAGLVFGNGPGRLSLFEGGVEETIAYVGMPFDGSTVTSLAFSPEGFNNLNQVAFVAGLADGRSIEVISQLPEPGAASLLVGCGALLIRRRSTVYRT